MTRKEGWGERRIGTASLQKGVDQKFQKEGQNEEELRMEEMR